MPNTVWSVTHNKLGDIVAGCADKTIRVFTRDVLRADDGPEFEKYEEECKKGAQPQGEAPNVANLLDFST